MGSPELLAALFAVPLLMSCSGLSRPALYDAHESLHDSLGSQSDLVRQFLKHSSRLIGERGLTEGYKPFMRISLVPKSSTIDYFSSSRFNTRPRLHFVFPVDIESRLRLKSSFAESLAVVHHELVHFASAFGNLEIPGEQCDQQRVNEEVFASLVQHCDQLSLVAATGLEGARITFPQPGGRFDGDMERTLSAAEEIGASATGKILAWWFLLQQFEPTGEPATGAEIQRLQNHCDSITHVPKDFKRFYNGDE